MASDRFTPSKYIAKKQPETQQVVVDISESISQIPNQDALITHTDRAKSLRMRATMNDDEKGSLSSAIKPFPQRSYPVMKKVKRELVSVLSERKGWTIFWLIVINVLCSTGLFVYSGTTNSLAFKALAEFLGRMKHTTVPLKALTSFSYLTIFDLLSLLTCLLSLWVSLQKPSTTFSFGYERFEVLAVFSSTVLVMFGGLFIVKESTERLLMPSEVITDNLLPAAAVGLFLHLLVTYGVSNKPFSLVSQTASSNWLQDAVNDFGHSICGFAPFLSQALVQKLNPISLVGIAGAGLVLITDAMITYNNSYVADSLCAIVAAFMMWATMLPLSVCSGQILLQTCTIDTMSQIDKCLREASTLDGVLEFRNEHFWTISFGRLSHTLTTYLQFGWNNASLRFTCFPDGSAVCCLTKLMKPVFATLQ
ncbi:zinc transporter 6-like isoform X4 [Acropora millepora]|uniref:zinc transporter 6-like isoform X4 n=1 Tax=Acropora millepora TaxID=45264 RepID=UPI001CF1E0D9|nr:zinc transporter 6-like isoform X4 [Acropora millepora]